MGSVAGVISKMLGSSKERRDDTRGSKTRCRQRTNTNKLPTKSRTVGHSVYPLPTAILASMDIAARLQAVNEGWRNGSARGGASSAHGARYGREGVVVWWGCGQRGAILCCVGLSLQDGNLLLPFCPSAHPRLYCPQQQRTSVILMEWPPEKMWRKPRVSG